MSAETDTTTTTEPCVPEGSVITDVDTGDTYVYGVPTVVGYDTCGNHIPDICVDWGDHYSTLWTVMYCGPDAAPDGQPVITVPVTDAPEPITELPATGGSGVLLFVAIGLAALGTILFCVARRSEPES